MVASAVPRKTGLAGSVLSSVTVMVCPLVTVGLTLLKSAVAVPLAEPVVPNGEPAVQVAVAVFVYRDLTFKQLPEVVITQVPLPVIESTSETAGTGTVLGL